MKRGILALGALALFAVPVAALGDAGATKALRGSEFEVSLELKVRDGEAVAVRDFRYKKLLASCDGDVTVRVRGQFPYMRVNDRRRFRDSIREQGHTVRVKGRVSRDLDTVRGRIRARGDFTPPAQDCDSGRVRWRAGT